MTINSDQSYLIIVIVQKYSVMGYTTLNVLLKNLYGCSDV